MLFVEYMMLWFRIVESWKWYHMGENWVGLDCHVLKLRSLLLIVDCCHY